MQNSIMMGILLTLLTKRKVTRQYLAHKYEISTRTVGRYVDALASAGVPICSHTGKEGGYSIYDDYGIGKMYMTGEERARIITCLNAMHKTFGDNLNAEIISRLENATRTEATAQHIIRTDSIYIDTASWTNPEFYSSKIELISRAIESCHLLCIHYTDRFEYFSQRQFEPLRLVFKEGVWYLYGYCLQRNDFRLLRLSRIQNMSVGDQTFEPRNGNLLEKLDGLFPTTPLIELSIEFSSFRLADIEEWLGSDSIRERGLHYTATATVYAGPQLIARLMALGSDVRILSPRSVREELMLECRRMMQYNDED